MGGAVDWCVCCCMVCNALAIWYCWCSGGVGVWDRAGWGVVLCTGNERGFVGVYVHVCVCVCSGVPTRRVWGGGAAVVGAAFVVGCGVVCVCVWRGWGVGRTGGSGWGGTGWVGGWWWCVCVWWWCGGVVGGGVCGAAWLQYARVCGWVGGWAGWWMGRSVARSRMLRLDFLDVVTLSRHT